MRFFLFLMVGVGLLLADNPVSEEPLPEIHQQDILTYWKLEAKAQRAEVELMKAKSARDAQIEVLRKQCGHFKLVVVDEERLICSK